MNLISFDDLNELIVQTGISRGQECMGYIYGKNN